MASAPSIIYTESASRRRQRVLIVIVVIALHLAVLLLFLAAPRSRHGVPALPQPLELIYVPTATLPKRKASTSDLPRRASDAAISITLPKVDFPLELPIASESKGHSTSDGVGGGVDWAAEARRELQAHEIRQNAPPDENHMAGRLPEESWWPRAAHQKGDQFKTDTGDWVVWISSNCYQVATAKPRSSGQGPDLPQTYCLSDSHSP